VGYGFDGFVLIPHGPHISKTRADARVGAQTTLYPVISSGLVTFNDTQSGTNAFKVTSDLVTVDDAGTVTARQSKLTFRGIYNAGLAVLWS